MTFSIRRRDYGKEPVATIPASGRYVMPLKNRLWAPGARQRHPEVALLLLFLHLCLER